MYVCDGALYGPYLWFWLANLNLIASLFELGRLPSTISPAPNVPDTIVTSTSLGTTNLAMSILSKNGYNLVFGFNLLQTNSMFLDLIVATTSVLTTLSPRLVVSNLSPTLNWIPSLVWLLLVTVVSVLNTSLLSNNCVVVVIGIPPLRGPTNGPRFWTVLERTVDCDSTLVTGPSVELLPVHVVSQPPQSTGERPVLLSAPVIPIIELKLPSISYVAEVLLVSIHVSVAGFSSTWPIQFTTANGFTFTILVANLFSRKIESS